MIGGFTDPQQSRVGLAVAMNQRGAHPFDEIGDLWGVPRTVAKLERHPPVARQQRRDPWNALLIERRRRRKLKEDWTKPVAEAADLQRQDADRLLEVWHAAVVRNPPVRFDREAERRWHRRRPAGDDVVRLGAVEGGVHLHRGEPLGIVRQHLAGLERLWVEPAAPARVGEARRPDEQLGARRHPATIL